MGGEKTTCRIGGKGRLPVTYTPLNPYESARICTEKVSLGRVFQSYVSWWSIPAESMVADKADETC